MCNKIIVQHISDYYYAATCGLATIYRERPEQSRTLPREGDGQKSGGICSGAAEPVAAQQLVAVGEPVAAQRRKRAPPAAPVGTECAADNPA